jgi:hypothetical protein
MIRAFEMNVNFYSLPDRKFPQPPSGIKYPAIVFFKNNWNDYGYETLYRVIVYTSINKSEEIGHLKILQNEHGSTSIPNVFNKLSNEYCSLGSIEYYQKLNSIFGKDAELILENLRDCAVNANTKKEFENNEIFKTSLLRESEYEKALYEAKSIIKGEGHYFNTVFLFQCKIYGFNGNHKIDFDFEPLDKDNKLFPHRVFFYNLISSFLFGSVNEINLS